MHRFAWIADGQGVQEALWPAGAPGRWLRELDSAAGSLERVGWAVDALAPFRRQPPLATVDPLQALAATAGPNPPVPPAAEQVPRGRAASSPRRAGPEHLPSAERAGQPRQAGRAGPAERALPLDSTRGRIPSPSLHVGARDSYRPLPAEHALPLDDTGGRIPSPSLHEGARDSHRPLPAGYHAIMPGKQLETLARGTPSESQADRSARSETAVAVEDRAGRVSEPGSQAPRLRWPLPTGQRAAPPASRPETPAATAHSRDARDARRQPRGSGAPAVSPSLGAKAQAPGRIPVPGQAENDPVVDHVRGVPGQTEAGAALLALLARHLTTEAEIERQMLLVAIRRAFGAHVGQGATAAIPGAEIAPSEAPHRRGVDRGSSLTPSTAQEATGPQQDWPATPASPGAVPEKAEKRDTVAVEGAVGIDLLRQSLARFSGPTPPARSPEHDEDWVRSGKTEVEEKPAKEAPHDADEAVPAPRVQNTFNVTVHMEGGLAGNEEELAERLTRILVEQARRYGIEV